METPKKSTKRPIALITGGSSGIGLELAKLCAQNGYALVLVARDKDRLRRMGQALQKTYGVPVKTIVRDLSLDSASAGVYTELKRAHIVPDVLINNAGFGDWGEFVKSDPAKTLAMMKTNMVAVTALTRLILPDMSRRAHGHGKGRILNVASIAAFFPGPLMSVYYATKSYVLSWSEALSEELRGSEITVSVLCPAPTDTRFAAAAQTNRSALFKGKLLEAKDVAEDGYAGMQRGKSVIIPGMRNKAAIFVQRFLPRKAVVRYVARAQRRLY